MGGKRAADRPSGRAFQPNPEVCFMDPEPCIVCKFGGTSLADAKQIRKVAAIIASDPRRRFIVPSAPGKRFDGDPKVTDLLYLCHDLKQQGGDFDRPFARVRERFLSTARDLGVLELMERDLNRLRRQLEQPMSRDFIASRGEYLCGRMLAAFLGGTFVDPADAIKIANDGSVLPQSYHVLAERLHGEGRFVIPGFYGSDVAGLVKTFSRGGSDLTGALVARAIGALVYENWTDVSGLLTADPRVVPGAQPVREVTYRELRELTHLGATVLHDEAVFPLREPQIPIHIRNTNAPDDPGTRTVTHRATKPNAVTAIAGMTGLTAITVEKSLLHCAGESSTSLLRLIDGRCMSMDTGVDSMSLVLRDSELGDNGQQLASEIRHALKPDRVLVTTGLALIAIVGHGIADRVGIAAQAFRALAMTGIKVRFTNHCQSRVSMVVGVATKDFERAMRSLHAEFLGLAAPIADVGRPLETATRHGIAALMTRKSTERGKPALTLLRETRVRP